MTTFNRAASACVGDSDLFRFQGTAGEVVLIKVVDFAGGAANPAASSSWCDLPGPSWHPAANSLTCQIRTTLDASGLFTARVSELGNNSLMTYSVELDRLAPPSPVARSINPGDTLVGSAINPRGDADLFVFNGVAGDTISLRLTDQAGSVRRSFLSLGVVPARWNARRLGYDMSPACIIDTTLNQTGVFTARVREQATTTS